MAKATASKKSAGKPANIKHAPQYTDPALFELLKEEVKGMYWAENHLTKALPKMSNAAFSEALSKAFEEHLQVTKMHVARLEQIFDLIGEETPMAKKCDAIEGLVKEGEAIIENTAEGTASRDVGLIMVGQKVEHYEMAAYGGLAQLAKTIGLADVAALLEETLVEEKQAGETLAGIAAHDINYQSDIEE